MSNSGGSSSSSRVSVSIPTSVRKTIQDIKEITSNHSEDDIYAMLKECSMDPNETTQRLLHLDTFHEVKRKRDKRKENVKSRSAEESRGKSGYQGQGARGARGGSYSQYSSNDAGGRRNAAFRKENGVDETREKGFRQSPVPVAKGTDSIQPPVEKSSFITMNGSVKVPNGTLSGGHGAQSSGVGDTHLLKDSSDASSDTSSRTIPKVNTEQTPRIPNDKELGTTETMDNSHLSQLEPQNVDGLDISSSMIKEDVIGQRVAEPKIPSECSEAVKIHTPECNSVLKSSSSRGTGQIGGVEEAASTLEKLKFPDGQHVIIPDHIQVPDAVKNVLSFGSIGPSFGVRENNLRCESKENSKPVADLVQEETALEPPSCDQDVVSIAPEGKIVEHLQSPSHVPEKISLSDPKVSSVATVPKNDKLEEEILPAVGPPFPVVQTAPSYSFGFMPPMLVNPLVHPQAFDSQVPVSDSLNGSSPPISTSASTPPPTQPNVGQNSVAMSPLQIALFRQPFPPNYILYSHYYSPIYVPPNMHQYFGHTAFPPTLPAGNVYLTPPAAAGGMKISPGPYKLGANTGNQVHTGLPSGYGAYTTSQVAVGPNAAVTSGNSSSSEDLVPSALKENNVYPVQQSEGPAVWFGRDPGSFPLNSFINLPPQQHPQGISPQSGPGGAFAVYHALQPMPSPGPGHGLTLLQQLSQPTAGPTESSVGPPSNAYQQQQQQPQRLQQQQQQQMNWNM